MKRLLWLSCAIVSLSACVQVIPGVSKTSDTTNRPSANVTNGQPIGENEYPAVVEISLYNDQSETHGTCTASFLRSDLLLTAAHCVPGALDKKGFLKNPENVTLGGIAATAAFRNQTYEDKKGLFAHDLAVVLFGTPMRDAVLKISSEPAESGDEITIVGYGLFNAEDQASAGRKRVGRNVLQERVDGTLRFHGEVGGTADDGVNSASGSGDSGGPMLVDGAIVGITSAGGVSDGVKRSIYVDLHSDIAKGFFKKARANGFDVPLPTGYLD